MENKQLSLEDRLKPYLILAKVLDRQDKKELVTLILNQMLKQVKFKDLNSNFFLMEGFPQEMLKEDEIEKESVNLSFTKLTDIIRLESIEDIKQQLEKAEKELNKD